MTGYLVTEVITNVNLILNEVFLPLNQNQGSNFMLAFYCNMSLADEVATDLLK